MADGKQNKPAKKRPAKQKSAKRRMQTLRRPRQLRFTGLAALIALAGAGLIWGVLVLSTGEAGDRMTPFQQAAAAVHDDLLYLSYIDSLARENRALPGAMAATDLLAQQLVTQAVISQQTATTWGLYPKPEEGHGPFNRLFRKLNRRGRVILPLYGAALGTHLKERRLPPGYLVFGQTPRAGTNEANLCAVLTAVNSIQPQCSVLIYRDPDSGQLVHGKFGDMPSFGYLGGGRLGDDIPPSIVSTSSFATRAAGNRCTPTSCRAASALTCQEAVAGALSNQRT